MKNYKETTESIIFKSEEIARQKTICKQRIARFAFIAVCLCILVGGGVAIRRGSLIEDCHLLFSFIEKDNNSNNRMSVADKSESREEESPMDNDYVSEDIYINNLSQVPSNAFYALREDLFKEMSKEEQMEYYGVKFDLSEVLTGFEEINANRYGIYFSGDGTECSSHVFQWEKAEKNISIELAKERIPLSAPFRMDGDGDWMDGSELVQSKIDNISVLICNYKDEFENEVYHAEFLKNGIGYSVYSKNLNETLFLNALIYLITDKLKMKG